MTDLIHSCGYFCLNPACIIAQRDELVAKYIAQPVQPATATQYAARYRWLRQQDWFNSNLCVLRDPKQVLTRGIGLGADCPSRERLDQAIDAAIAAKEAGKC